VDGSSLFMIFFYKKVCLNFFRFFHGFDMIYFFLKVRFFVSQSQRFSLIPHSYRSLVKFVGTFFFLCSEAFFTSSACFLRFSIIFVGSLMLIRVFCFRFIMCWDLVLLGFQYSYFEGTFIFFCVLSEFHPSIIFAVMFFIFVGTFIFVGFFDGWFILLCDICKKVRLFFLLSVFWILFPSSACFLILL
jgi:hypothetical protein